MEDRLRRAGLAAQNWEEAIAIVQVKNGDLNKK